MTYPVLKETVAPRNLFLFLQKFDIDSRPKLCYEFRRARQRSVIFVESSSNLPEPASGSPAVIPADEKTRAKGKMTISEILSKAFEIYKKNPIIIVPSLIPFVALILGLAIFFAGFVGVAALIGEGGFLGFFALAGLFLFIILLIILFFVAEGLTIEMIKDALAGNKADLNIAWETSKPKMQPLILTSILAGILTALGYMLLIIPGLILTVIFYFVAQAVMIDGRSGTIALKTSYGFVKANLTDSVIIILISMAISFLLPMIPLIGVLLSLLSIPYLYALATMFYIDRMVNLPPKAETKVDVS
jgi:hypothetical protein